MGVLSMVIHAQQASEGVGIVAWLERTKHPWNHWLSYVCDTSRVVGNNTVILSQCYNVWFDMLDFLIFLIHFIIFVLISKYLFIRHTRYINCT